jgi:hypothetical protein
LLNFGRRKMANIKYPEIKGLCKKCLGCNRLEDYNFRGVYRCEYATEKQMSINDLRKEFKKNGP